MASRYYNTLKSNIETLGVFIDFIPNLVTAMPEAIVKNNVDFFIHLMAGVLSYLFENPEKNLSIKKAQEDLQRIISPHIHAAVKSKLIKNIRKTTPRLLKHKVFSKNIVLCRNTAAILLVSYFEAYSKDYFLNIVNRNPKYGLPFLDKSLKIEDIKEYGFDLSKSIGSLISKKINFQNIDEVEQAYGRAFKVDIFNQNLSLRKKLVKLFQDRHILVHNNGKIDKKYISITKCNKNNLRKRIIITKKQLKEYTTVILAIADNIERIKII